MTQPYSTGSIRVVTIVGCGRLGSAFAEALTHRGVRVIPVSARRRVSSEELAIALGLGDEHYPSIPDAGRGTTADMLILTVPDDAIQIVASEVAEAGLVQPGTVVVHPSGSLTSDVLDLCRARGAVCASLHPLQTFPRGVGDGARFEGITFAFEGEAAALPPLRDLAFRLGADVFQVEGDDKTAYHTAAVLACNCLVSLLHAAVQLFGRAGSLPTESMKRLRPLIDATLDNITDLGAVDALTGPWREATSTRSRRRCESSRRRSLTSWTSTANSRVPSSNSHACAEMPTSTTWK